ncbi:MAG: hypothetical protein ACFB02_08820 [Mastigocoleus sp.]
MSKKENNIGLILILSGTFAINAIGIWCAYKFGSSWNSSSNNSVKNTNQEVQKNTENSNIVRITDNKSNIRTEVVTPKLSLQTNTKQKLSSPQNNIKQKLLTPKPTPTPTITPEIKKPELQGRVKFLTDTAYVSNEDLQTLKQIAGKIKQYKSDKVNIYIKTNSGKSEFTQTIAKKRGEEIAGYLRHLGLKHKIIISEKGSANSSNNLSPRRQRNLPIEIYLHPRRR